jgi:DNA modification methylase
MAVIPQLVAEGVVIDAIVTDPPYHLTDHQNKFKGKCAELASDRNQGAIGRLARGFMNQIWDGGDLAFRPETWATVATVLRPGGFLLAFGGTRTSHRMICAIEDAGFVIQDTIMWLYGCLSEDTQLVTARGVAQYQKVNIDDPVLCYNPDTSEYSWQPIQEIYEYDIDDTVLRIQSDRTDQIVSRNHRCLIERGGVEAFEFAEAVASQREARVPVLEDLPGLLKALPNVYGRTGEPKSDLFASMRRATDRRAEQGQSQGAFGSQREVGLLRRLRERGLETGCLVAQGPKTYLQPVLSSSLICGPLAAALRKWKRETPARNWYGRLAQSCLEGWRYLSAQARELCIGSLCPMSAGVSVDGARGRLRHGASLGRGAGYWPSVESGRVSAPRQSQAARQSAGQPDAICHEPRPQAVRGWRGHHADLVRITTEAYQGKVWCVRVPTGAFVAVRNGKAFPTGNSGFPKRRDMLKPAVEPICVAYKPGGKRALQVDECRIGTDLVGWNGGARRKPMEGDQREGAALGLFNPGERQDAKEITGRWPANVCHDGSAEVMGAFAAFGERRAAYPGRQDLADAYAGTELAPSSVIGFADKRAGRSLSDTGSAARFFYCAKAAGEDRWGSRHPCLTPGNAVLTDQGLRAIETIVTGSRVLAHDGSFRDVIDQFATPCDAPIYRIGVAGTNLTTTATGNHPFIVWRPKISGNRARETIAVGKAGWCTAENLRVGDYLLSPVSNRGQRDNGESVGWWFAAGLWLAEGTVLTNGHGSSRFPQFSLASHETDLVDRLQRTFRKATVYPKPGNAISVVVFESGVVDRFISLCGSGAKNKRVAAAVFDECPAHRRAFLDGYLAGDGCTIRSKRRAKTASRDLAATLVRLGESLGWRASYYEYDESGSAPKFIDGRPIKPGVYYSIYFDGETEAPEFGRLPGKQNSTRFIEVGAALGCRYYSLRRVKSIEADDYRGEVWNLTVRGAHSFQTIVGASHNTVKPVELLKWLVALVTPPGGGTVLDCFAGSGTTGVAALATGRNAILIEREPSYCDDIRVRIAHYDGAGRHSLAAKARNRQPAEGTLL